MVEYLEGKCKECGNRIAAAVNHDEETWKEDIAEFVINGYEVNIFETSGRVEVEAHESTCSHEPRKVKEIRPENAGELWRHEDGSIGIIIKQSESSPLGIAFDNGTQKHLSDTNLASGKNKPYREYLIHNKNGWERLYPPVEDDSVETIEIEGVEWENCKIEGQELHAMVPLWRNMNPWIGKNLINKPPMKMILEIPKI